MIKTVVISDIKQIGELLVEQQFNESIGRYRSSYFFRGMCNVDFHLLTSLSRNCKDKQCVLEKSMLKNFTKYAALEDPTLDESIWKQMIVGQHHGLPTRLLDWTHSIIVALHFACTEGNLDALDKHDCAVWRIDARELNKQLPQEYRDALDATGSFIMNVDMLKVLAPSIDDYDNAMGNNGMVILEPPSIDPRIINQFSFFSVIPKGIDNIEQYLEETPCETVKYVIEKELRWQIRDILDQHNMNERIIYPGLDGISQWIARHFFVKGVKGEL